MIRLVKKEDIHNLAIIYKDLYDNVDIGEDWSIEKSEDLLNYWYGKQGDLFYVAEEDGKAVGAIVSGVKSWFDGPRLIDTEIFVSKEYQEKHLGRLLLLEHLKQAKIKYNVKMIEFHTYGDEDEFPQNWYNRIGLEKDQELIIMHGDVEEVLNNLGYFNNDAFNTDPKVTNYSYNELSDLYNKFGSGDKVFIFDMLPEYAYLDNEEERRYIESEVKALIDSNVTLFIIGTQERLDSFKDNKFFNYVNENCGKNSKIYIIKSDEVRRENPLEYFQLAQGLYLGIREDGSKECFRDLWVNKDNIGLFIKDISICNYLEACKDKILDSINNNKIKCIKVIEGGK